MGNELAVALPAKVELDAWQRSELRDLGLVLDRANHSQVKRRIAHQLEGIGQKPESFVALEPSCHQQAQGTPRRRIGQARRWKIDLGKVEGRERDDGLHLAGKRHACGDLAGDEFRGRDHAFAHAHELTLQSHHDVEAVAGMHLGVVHHDGHGHAPLL